MYLQKQKNWTNEENEEIIEDTLESLEKIIKSSQKVTLVADFNFSEVKWGRARNPFIYFIIFYRLKPIPIWTLSLTVYWKQ